MKEKENRMKKEQNIEGKEPEEKEEWKEIEGFSDYQISNLGRVKSLKRNKEKILKAVDGSRHYLYISLYSLNKKSTYTIHRLVLKAFKLIDDFELLQCNHIDGNKQNNSIDNLEWCTNTENIRHAFKTGLLVGRKGEDNPMYGKHPSEETRKKMSEKQKCRHASEETKEKLSKIRSKLRGETNPYHKLTEKQVLEIRLLLKEGRLLQREIAEMFGVGRYVISMIKLRKIWKHI